jgi:hypothetical protein
MWHRGRDINHLPNALKSEAPKPTITERTYCHGLILTLRHGYYGDSTD